MECAEELRLDRLEGLELTSDIAEVGRGLDAGLEIDSVTLGSRPDPSPDLDLLRLLELPCGQPGSRQPAAVSRIVRSLWIRCGGSCCFWISVL